MIKILSPTLLLLLFACGEGGGSSDNNKLDISTISDHSLPFDLGDLSSAPLDVQFQEQPSQDEGFRDRLLPDAALPWPEHCPIEAPPPEWLEQKEQGGDIRCADQVLEIRAYAEGIIQLRYHPPEIEPPRSWVVKPPLIPPEFWMGAQGGRALLCTQEWVLGVDQHCHLKASDREGPLVEDGEAGGWRSEPEGFLLQRESPLDEVFYGFGERNGPLQRRGQRMIFWNTDAYDTEHGGFGPDQDPLYLSIPFFIGLRKGRAYGVFSDHSPWLSIDMAASDPERYQIQGRGASLEQYLIAGPKMSEVLRRYAEISGKMELPPRWALGYHQCRWGYESAQRVLEIAQELRARQIPADGLWLDIQHMEGFRTFSWGPSFSDPQSLIQGLDELGFKLTLIADPGIKVDANWPLFQEAQERGLFMRWPDGRLYEGIAWPGPSAFPDFSLAEARDWWAEQIAGHARLGVRGIWLDVNEPTIFPEGGAGTTPPDELLLAGGSLGELHNLYALLQAQATQEGLLRGAPGHRPFILSRAGYSGIQSYAAIWTGDAPSSWESLRQVLPMLLNMGLSGIPWVGSDVGGYSGHASPKLFARWMALGSLSPFFRGHVTQGVPGQEPWMFGQEVEDISRSLIQQRYRLLPYLYTLFAEAHEHGAPILRPLIYHFQEESELQELEDQALLGPSLLLAPALEEGNESREILLPPGRWLGFRSGALFEGRFERRLKLADLPLFLREGAIIPQAPFSQRADEPISALWLDLYPGVGPSEFLYYEDEGEGFGYREGEDYRVRYQLSPQVWGAVLQASASEGRWHPPPRPFKLRFRPVDHPPEAVLLDGVALEAQGSLRLEAPGFHWDREDRSLWVALPRESDFLLQAHYNPALEDRAQVQLFLSVQVPPGTPQDQPIYFAGDPNAWEGIPLEWVAEDRAEGLISVPRGAWFEYKYHRGDWDTVEKWPHCEEAQNRYGFGSAAPRRDRVFGWRDWCDSKARRGPQAP